MFSSINTVESLCNVLCLKTTNFKLLKKHFGIYLHLNYRCRAKLINELINNFSLRNDTLLLPKISNTLFFYRLKNK